MTDQGQKLSEASRLHAEWERRQAAAKAAADDSVDYLERQEREAYDTYIDYIEEHGLIEAVADPGPSADLNRQQPADTLAEQVTVPSALDDPTRLLTLAVEHDLAAADARESARPEWTDSELSNIAALAALHEKTARDLRAAHAAAQAAAAAERLAVFIDRWERGQTNVVPVADARLVIEFTRKATT